MTDVIESNNPITDDGDEDSTHKAAITQAFNRLASRARDYGMVTQDDLTFEGRKVILPETMNIDDAIKFLKRRKEQNETTIEVNRIFDYRPYDGAHAFDVVLRRELGMSGLGKPIYTFFGKQNPPMQSIQIGPEKNDRVQVPFGTMEVESLEGEVMIGGMDSPTGPLFRVVFEIPRKYRLHAEGLLAMVQDELEHNSIYRGKAIDGDVTPNFIDLTRVDSEATVYSKDVEVQLEANVWSMLRHTDAMESHGIPMKRSVLFEGPYGTGKTIGAFKTAQVAVANGWTFIYCRPVEDDLVRTMETARLYQPSVVFFEDIDTAEGHQRGGASASRLLDAFDGIQQKGTRMLAVLTTNHVEKVHPGLVRPGRLDAVIHFDELDRDATEVMIRQVIPDGSLEDDVDFDQVYQAMNGFMPAFVREVVDRVVRYSIARNDGSMGSVSTSDLVHAAEGLRPQLDLMNRERGEAKDTFESLIGQAVHNVVDGSRLLRFNGDPIGQLRSDGEDKAKA